MSAPALTAAPVPAASRPPGGAGALLAVGGLGRGERRRLAQSVGLAVGAVAAGIALLATSGYLISRAAQHPQVLALMVTIVAVRAFGLTRAGLRYAERLSSHDLALRRLARLRAGFYRCLEPLVPGELRRGGGELTARFVGDVDNLADLYLRALIPGLVALCVILGAGCATFLMLPAAGVAVLAALLLAAVAAPWSASVVAARADRRQAAVRASLAERIVEVVEGAEELLMNGCGDQRVRELEAIDGELRRLARRDALAASTASVLGGLIAAAGLLAVLVVGIGAVRAGSLAGVLLASLAFLMLGAYEALTPLPAAARTLRASAASARRLQEIATARPAVADPPAPLRPSGHGELRAQALCFGYAGGPRLFEGLDLTLAPGERVALVGPSGAGKSTLAELLVRFRDPTAGRVSLDGLDVRDLAQGELRRAVLLCGQDAHLFNTSIRHNLLLARPDAGEDALWAALRAVELDDWAATLPEGIDTLVGAEGQALSGGQRQRLALARVLLAPARFLVLDEPTAHLDAPLARRVMANVLRAAGEKGVLVVTHDPELASGCGRVVRLGS